MCEPRMFTNYMMGMFCFFCLFVCSFVRLLVCLFVCLLACLLDSGVGMVSCSLINYCSLLLFCGLFIPRASTEIGGLLSKDYIFVVGSNHI